MGSFWEHFILTTAAGVLATLKANPANAAQHKPILQHIINDASIVISAVEPSPDATQPQA